MRYLILIFVFLVACQDIPQKYKTPEGKKILEKYKKQYVKGTVSLSPEIKQKLPKNYFLIISVRKINMQRPVAVLRVENPKFPYRFKIYGKHKINPDDFIEGDLIITARISKEPTAGFKDGDLYGMTTAKAGQEDVELIITEVFKENGK